MKKLLLTMMLASLTACHPVKKVTKPHIIEITTQDYNEQLYFNGIITPLKIHPINIAMDGTIKQQAFHYGETVQKGQLLFEIESSALEKEVHTALADYVKTRHEYEERKRKFAGTKKLWELGFIPANEFYSDRNSLEDAHTNLVQSEYKLQQILAIENDNKNFKAIEAKTPAEIDRLLAKRQDQLCVYAPVTGVALTPDKQLGNPEGGDPVKLGSTVKAGQILINIGDMSGLSIALKVNEINVNQLKVGQSVTVTGVAFPELTLHGKVTEVNVQAEGQSSELPNFPVTVSIPSLAPEQQQLIHVGMSAKVAITLAHHQVILIPLEAIIHQKGQEWVKCLTNQQTHLIPVKLGKTTATQVIVKSGLKTGDRIVYTD